ncbi:uncharacterized protein [Euwallacea similis]|uniref:uncharacterized protein n=1 Tax=Euwallacea similis TaxID=1736056 RepID=UPI00344E2974
MITIKNVLLLASLSFVHCEDPRKRMISDLRSYHQSCDEIICNPRNYFKRSSYIRQDEDMGPFWANRGKKDPAYAHARLLVDEPKWILFPKNLDNESFFNSRGKKPAHWNALTYYSNLGDIFGSRRDRRDFENDMELNPIFFAARGKKLNNERFIN